MRFSAAVLLLLSAAALSPLEASTVVLDFEGFNDSTSLTTQYPGLTFTNATIITSGISLNEFELPPHSGVNVVFDDGGPMTISFASPIVSFGGYFTYYEPLTLQAFDASDAQVASATSAFSINVGCDPGPVCLGDPGSNPNEFLQVAFPNGISSVTITGDTAGSSFVMDDATITTAATSVPEPSYLIVFLSVIGLAALITAIRKKHIHLLNPMKAIVLVLGIAIILGVGAIWLYATPTPEVPQTAARHIEGQSIPASTPTTTITSPLDVGQIAKTSTVTSTNVSAAATTAHSIDWVSIAPPSIASGAASPVTITAQITDPAVIRNSVNLLSISSTGPAQIIGTLSDNGLNGDAVAGDNIFTIVASFAQYPTGAVNLRISAAFSGSLLRTQTGPFQLNITSPVATANWVTLTDSQRLFSIQVPSTWGLVVAETPGDDPGTIKNVHFEFPDGTIVFTISVNPTSSFDTLQNGDGPQPVFLGQNSKYVFGESDTQAVIGNETISMTEIAQTLSQIMATFRIL